MPDLTPEAVASAAVDAVQKTMGDKYVSKADYDNLKKGADDLQKELASAKEGFEKRFSEITVSEPNAMKSGTFGYASFGDFAKDVSNFVTRRQYPERLKMVAEKGLQIEKGAPPAGTYANDAVGADGGFLIAPDYRAEILRHLNSEESLLPRTRQLFTTGNSVSIPKDETVPWGTDGVQVVTTAEAQAITGTKYKVGQLDIPLHKLAALVPVTNEQLEDAAFNIGNYLMTIVPPKFTSKINTLIINGSGTGGQPLGYRKSGAYIVTTKTSGQASNTYTAANALGMVVNLQKEGGQPVWLYNPTVLPQLGTMVIGQQPVYTAGPLRTVTSSVPAQLFGYQAQECQDCNTLSNQSDVELVDLSKYVTVQKNTGMRMDMSVHLYFDADVSTFRFVYRLGGQPWQTAPITLKDGTTLQSPFVGMGAR